MHFPPQARLGERESLALGDWRRRTQALLGLLTDDSPVVQRVVRAALLRGGKAAGPALRRAIREADPLVRARARIILTEQVRQRAWRRLCGYLSSRKIELEPALFLLAAYQHPGQDARPYRQTLDRLADGLRQSMAKQSADGSRARELARYLGQELGYRGDRRDYHHPANASLTSALERRCGLPLTLAALYRCVARRVGLRAELLPVPGHVLLLVFDGNQRLMLDPFDAGRVLSIKDCHQYLKQHGLPIRREYFEPASDAQMMLRQLANLWRSARERKWRKETTQLGQLRRLLEKRAFLRQRPAS